MSHDRRMAMASIDPNAAIAASRSTPAPPAPRIVRLPVEAPYEDLVVSVEVARPRMVSWWRFAVFWLLIRLAARVYQFRFEMKVARRQK